MYNIHSHYENIWHFLRTIVTHPRLLYLMPYGSTQPENLEMLTTDQDPAGPLFIFYDQEPIIPDYNQNLFDYISENFAGPFILVTTERNSDAVDEIKSRYGWPVVYNFHHVFAAHDWFRGYDYDVRLISPEKRKLKKKYITFNRLTSERRVYRSLLIAELFKRGILNHGHVSYNDSCPEGSTYTRNLLRAAEHGLISSQTASDTINVLKRIAFPLRIDYQDTESIPNHSFVLSAVPESQESFCYLVTETCFWERKDHLTEKIFKPIVSRMPFLVVGPAGSLRYLREYGFQTFGKWFDESYDDITDPVTRLQAVVNALEKICRLPMDQLQELLIDMTPVLEHNYHRFNSKEFLDLCWQELGNGLRSAIS